jgi:hypothetical protein
LHTDGSTLTQKTFWWCQRRSTTTLAMNEKPPLRFAKNHPSEDAKSGRLPILGRGGFLKMEDPQHG